MLTRDQQHLLAAIGADLASSALTDQVRLRGTLEGARSTDQPGRWIQYNRGGVTLEERSLQPTAARAAHATGSASVEERPRLSRRVLVRVTWSEAAAYGASLPPDLRAALAEWSRELRAETISWSQFSTARGGWPWRRNFASDAAFDQARAEWDRANGRHVSELRCIREGQRDTVVRALPLTVDDEPLDLLELLERQTHPTADKRSASALQQTVLGCQSASHVSVTSQPQQMPPAAPRR